MSIRGGDDVFIILDSSPETKYSFGTGTYNEYTWVLWEKE